MEKSDEAMLPPTEKGEKSKLENLHLGKILLNVLNNFRSLQNLIRANKLCAQIDYETGKINGSLKNGKYDQQQTRKDSVQNKCWTNQKEGKMNMTQ